MAAAVEANGLIERIRETLVDYSEANPGTSTQEALVALEFVHAVIHRKATGLPAHKLH